MERIDWKPKDAIALFVIPLELTVGWLLSKTSLTGNTIFASLLPLFLKAISMLIIALLFRDLLADNWRRFRKRLWLKLLVCAGLAVCMTFVLAGVRGLTGLVQSAEIMDSVTGGVPYGLFLLAAFTPALAPVTEEIVFRHVLFYKFRGRLALCILMCVVSSVLFGAIHYTNFGGNLLLTVPYMVVACLYNLLYLFTKNIWTSITVHFIFNFSQSVVPALMIPFIVAGAS